MVSDFWLVDPLGKFLNKLFKITKYIQDFPERLFDRDAATGPFVVGQTYSYGKMVAFGFTPPAPAS